MKACLQLVYVRRQIYAPANVNIYTNVITKTAVSDAKSYFNISTVGVGFPPWDSWQWACITSVASGGK